jgi:hypothetical protein
MKLDSRFRSICTCTGSKCRQQISVANYMKLRFWKLNPNRRPRIDELSMSLVVFGGANARNNHARGDTRVRNLRR